MNKDIIALAVMLLGIFLMTGWMGFFNEWTLGKSRSVAGYRWWSRTNHVMVFFLYLIGVSGLLLAFKSVQSKSKPHVAYKNLFIGIMLLIVCYFALETLL